MLGVHRSATRSLWLGRVGKGGQDVERRKGLWGQIKWEFVGYSKDFDFFFNLNKIGSHGERVVSSDRLWFSFLKGF